MQKNNCGLPFHRETVAATLSDHCQSPRPEEVASGKRKSSPSRLDIFDKSRVGSNCECPQRKDEFLQLFLSIFHDLTVLFHVFTGTNMASASASMLPSIFLSGNKHAFKNLRKLPASTLKGNLNCF